MNDQTPWQETRICKWCNAGVTVGSKSGICSLCYRRQDEPARVAPDTDLTAGADSDLPDEQRGPCYKAWTAYRDQEEARGDCADLSDFRAGFMQGWLAHTVAHERLGWVPVSEKLPDNGSYLVTIIDPDDQSVTVRSLSFMGGWEDDELVDIFGVIAWQPLPEPYKQGETE